MADLRDRLFYAKIRSLLRTRGSHPLPLLKVHSVYLNQDLETSLKNLKHEAELFKGAMLAGVKYAEGRGVVEFEATDSASEKLLYIYRLLVHDKVIQPLPEDQVAEKTLRHKLAIWYSKQLPKDHPLLK